MKGQIKEVRKEEGNEYMKRWGRGLQNFAKLKNIKYHSRNKKNSTQ